MEEQPGDREEPCMTCKPYDIPKTLIWEAWVVAQLRLEPLDRLSVDPRGTLGYRPGKSALEANAVTRRRCWSCDWVVEFDIRGLFDNLDHGLLMKALHKHCQEPWILLYVERWL